MASHAEKGRQLMAEALERQNVQVQGGGGGGMCCGRSAKRKIEEACELYVKAANSFKMAKDWEAAGKAFTEAATLEVENTRPHEAQSHFAEAAKCFKKVSAKDCARCLEKCIEISTDLGRTRVSAKHHQTLAEMYEEEGECKDLVKSVHHYTLAGELFSGEQSSSGATKCRLQVAKLYALTSDYAKAADIYEEDGRTALESNLLKYTAIDLFLRAGLCRLYLYTSTNAEGAAEKMAETMASYEDSNPAFGDSRDATLLRNMSQAVSAGDVDAFNDAIRVHENVSRLDSWYHEVIKAIRKFVSGNPDLR